MDHILLIDDDLELCRLLEEFLGGEGFVVSTVHEGREGVSAALSGDHQLAVLDVMLPGLDGLAALRTIRESSDLPVIMLTARGDDGDRILGLEIGADDYVPKPFNPRELSARIRAVLRRPSPGRTNRSGRQPLSVGDVLLSPTTRRARLAGSELVLTGAEFDLLTMLLERKGEIVERGEMCERVLDREQGPFDRSIDVHLSRLRKKLGPHPSGQTRLKTVRGVGYIYTPDEFIGGGS